MPFFRTENGLVLFAHVPRCGGSSVENYLHGRFGKLGFLDRAFGQRPADRRWHRTSPQHIDRMTLDRLIPAEFFVAQFAVVRHPLKRLQSVYLHNREVLGHIPEGQSFEAWLDDLPRLRRRDAGYLDNHARPMAEIVPGGARVFRLEQGLHQVTDWLDELTGTTWPRQIGMVHSRAQLLQKRGTEAVPHHLSPEAAALVAGLYERDYERFGYDPQPPATQETDS